MTREINWAEVQKLTEAYLACEFKLTNANMTFAEARATVAKYEDLKEDYQEKISALLFTNEEDEEEKPRRRRRKKRKRRMCRCGCGERPDECDGEEF